MRNGFVRGIAEHINGLEFIVKDSSRRVGTYMIWGGLWSSIERILCLLRDMSTQRDYEVHISFEDNICAYI